MITHQRRRGQVQLNPRGSETVRTSFGPELAGRGYDHRGLIARLSDMRMGFVECYETLAATPRESLVAFGVTEAELVEIETLLARRGFRATWSTT